MVLPLLCKALFKMHFSSPAIRETCRLLLLIKKKKRRRKGQIQGTAASSAAASRGRSAQLVATVGAV